MTSWGRQQPDGPLEPPPDWFSAENIKKRASVPADVSKWASDAFGAVLANMLGGGGDPEPGPPYVHMVVPPNEGRHWDRFMPDDGDD